VDNYDLLAMIDRREEARRTPRLAVGGHNVLYGWVKSGPRPRRRDWFAIFAREVRASLGAVLLAALIFFGAAILSNNLQVTILAFAPGMTAGLGTGLILLYNGVHLGSVFGWMRVNDAGRALWGWVMPHVATEIAAIVIAGAGGSCWPAASSCPASSGARRR
jgi:uncharacterized membrane protein SpoIIM required for sporulation